MLNNTRYTINVLKILLLFLVIGMWEIGIYFFSTYMADDTIFKYRLSARYSARTSFFILLAILFWTGFSDLSKIYEKENQRMAFIVAVMTFSINHVIHFGFIVLHYWYNGLSIFKSGNMFGAMGYIIIIIVPIFIWKAPILTKQLHLLINVFLCIAALFFLVTYLGRLSKKIPMSSPSAFYYLCLILISVGVGLNIYRFLKHKMICQKDQAILKFKP